MSFIGKPVYKVWAVNGLRFGKVAEEKIENGRKYVRVDWKDDTAYQMDVKRVVELRKIDYDSNHEWDYIGNIKIFDPSKMISTLTKLC
jgi:hypothetical protein